MDNTEYRGLAIATVDFHDIPGGELVQLREQSWFSLLINVGHHDGGTGVARHRRALVPAQLSHLAQGRNRKGPIGVQSERRDIS